MRCLAAMVTLGAVISFVSPTLDYAVSLLLAGSVVLAVLGWLGVHALAERRLDAEGDGPEVTR